MKPLKLEDLCPQQGRFRLKSTGETEYTLRPMTLADRAWINATFPGKIDKIFSQLQANELSQIVYRLMDDDSKAKFKPRSVRIFNEDTGVETSGEVGGWRLLAAIAQGGLQELEGMMKALLHTIGISEPIIEELAKVDESAEKKTPDPAELSAGAPPSTSLPASTDTPSIRSAG